MPKSLQLIDSVYHNAGDPIFIVDRKGKILSVNKAASRALGYTVKELSQKTIYDIDPDITPTKHKFIEKQAKKKSAVIFNGHHIKSNGVVFPVRVQISEIQYRDQPCYCAVVHDMSDVEAVIKLLAIRLKYEKTLNFISHVLSNPKHLDQALKDVASALRKLMEVDCCCCLILYSADKQKISQIVYSSDEKRTAFFDQLKQAPLSDFAWLNKKMSQQSIVQINDVDKLPKTAEKLKQNLKQQKIKSVLIVPIMMGKKLTGFICFDLMKGKWDAREDNVYLLEAAADIISQALLSDRYKNEILDYQKSLESMLVKTIESMTSIVEAKDPFTAGHQMRVATLAKWIGDEMGISAHDCQQIYLGGLIHDIGKLSIPYEILSTPRKLTESEYEIVKKHPLAGYEFIKKIPFEDEMKRILLEHHERYDGSGYPLGLKKKRISLFARIVAVADVYESMISIRPYHPTLKKKDAIMELKKNSGKKYDPEVVEACLKVVNQKGFKLPSVF